MTNIKVYGLDYSQATINRSHGSLMAQMQQLERKTFPRNEALDFDLELKKRNTEVIAVLDSNAKVESEREGHLVGYVVWGRLQKTALLHKVCVAKQYRRRGIARRMLNIMKDRLRRNGCVSIQLWVGEARVPATCLYLSLGFSEVDRVEDYYSPGRTGIKMKAAISRNLIVLAWSSFMTSSMEGIRDFYSLSPRLRSHDRYQDFCPSVAIVQLPVTSFKFTVDDF
ncbi:MAG: hypothetical protein Q9187_002228 [Circinaria calcarea]